MADLVPRTHEVFLLKLLFKGDHIVTNDVLGADLAIVDRFEGLRDGHLWC